MVLGRFLFLILIFFGLRGWAGEDVLREPLNMIGQLNLGHQSLKCEAPDTCTSFLKKLNAGDQNSYMGVLESQYKSCEVLIRDSEFTSKEKLNDYLGGTVFPRLGPFVQSQIQRCSGGETESEKKRMSALQYYNLARLELGQSSVLNEISEIENILGTDSKKYLQDQGFDCGASVFQSVVRRCEQLKKDCSPQARMDEILESTQTALDNIAKDQSLIKEKTAALLAMGLRKRKTTDEGKRLADDIEKLKTLIVLEQQTHPWILGPQFEKYKDKDLKKAITEQLTENKSKLEDKFNLISQNASCVTTRGTKCNTGGFRQLVDQMPELPDTKKYSGPDKAKSLAAGSYLEFEKCLHNAKMDQMQTAETVVNRSVAVVAIGISFLGPAPLALLADTAWLGAGGVETYKACTGHITLNKNPSSSEQNTCPEKGFSNPSQVAALHGNCLTTAAYTAMAAIPIAGAALKATKVVDVAHLPAGERRIDNVETLFAQNNKRAVTERVITGPDGVVQNTVKPKTISNMPDGLKLVEVKNPEGKKVLYYQAKEKLPDGTWVKSSREVQLDPLTGAIDSNYPAGRELFEKMAQAKAGKAYVAFVDVGSLGAVNKTFVAGSAAGDRYIKAVADKIMAHSDGKITLTRLGGDEFGMIIDETDPKKVKTILEAIQKDLRMDVKGDGKQVFREEKIQRAETYRQDPSPENRQRLQELSQIQQPDISIGSSQVGQGDSLETLLNRSEDQAKAMKIQTALEFGRSATKYGSSEVPRSQARPMFRATIAEPQTSSSWSKASDVGSSPALDQLRDVSLARKDEMIRFQDTSVARYEDELGRSSYRIERYTHDADGKTHMVSSEVPMRGQTGMLDGQHPESQKLVMSHFKSSPDNLLVMPKLSNLKYINYFQDGSKAGDKMLEAVSHAIKKQMRDTDMGFKLGGADFLLSLSHADPKTLMRIESRMNAELAKSKEVKQLVQDEIKALDIRRAEATQAGDNAAAFELRKKMVELEKFTPIVQFRSVTAKEVVPGEGFSDVVKDLDRKFEKSP